MQFLVAVISDLFRLGTRWDDGQPLVGEVFHVMVEASNGTRWVHNLSFPAQRMVVCDETGEPYAEELEGALERAERLASRVGEALRSGQRLDRTCWSETDPAYGSEAYHAMDVAGFFKAREEREDQF